MVHADVHVIPVNTLGSWRFSWIFENFRAFSEVFLSFDGFWKQIGPTKTAIYVSLRIFCFIQGTRSRAYDP